MKKWILALSAAAVLSACGSKNEGVVACEAATKDMMAMVEKAGNPAVAEMMKKQIETSKAAWAQISDQKMLADSCKAATESMKAALAAMPK